MQKIIDTVEKLYPGVLVAIEDQYEDGFKFVHPESDLHTYVDHYEFIEAGCKTIEVTIPGAWKIIDSDQLEVAHYIINEFMQRTANIKTCIVEDRSISVTSVSMYYDETLEDTMSHLVEMAISGFVHMNEMMDKELFVE
jgi:hypothetical protein